MIKLAGVDPEFQSLLISAKHVVSSHLHPQAACGNIPAQPEDVTVVSKSIKILLLKCFTRVWDLGVCGRGEKNQI